MEDIVSGVGVDKGHQVSCQDEHAVHGRVVFLGEWERLERERERERERESLNHIASRLPA